METIQPHGVHHITLVGADKQTSMDFWEGVLGFPFVFDQPNLDDPNENHLYFEPGDGRLITVFTDETRKPTGSATSKSPGAVHHIAFDISKRSLDATMARLEDRGIKHSGIKDRGFMHSVYIRDPLGLTIELASYVFSPPKGATHSDVLKLAFAIRLAKGDYTINKTHLDQAIAELS